VDFQVLSAIASGLIMRLLKVLDNNNYQIVRWM